MPYRKNVDVMTLDDRKIGEVDLVVMDPQSLEVTHLIVRKGFLFSKDKVLSIDLVETAQDDQVLLKKKLGELGELPDFE